jgi:hypothetical protein
MVDNLTFVFLFIIFYLIYLVAKYSFLENDNSNKDSILKEFSFY